MIPAVIADSWFFWLAIIDGLAAVYILPTVIGIARQERAVGGIMRSFTPRRQRDGASNVAWLRFRHVYRASESSTGGTRCRRR